MTDKVLTIVIPAYNASKFINRCLDSLVSVSNLNELEILVINDGSKDNTADCVQLYCDRYPDSVRLINKENGNVGSVYNCGFSFAKGKYVKEIDADDWADSQNLEKLINDLSEADEDLILNNYQIADENRVVTERVKCIRTDQYNQTLSVKENGTAIIPAMHAMTYKTSVLQNLPVAFDEKCYYVDTEYVVFPMIDCKTFKALNYDVYQYLVGTSEQSVNINNMVKNINQHRIVLLKSMIYQNQYLQGNPVAYQCISHMVYTHLLICLSMKDHAKGKEYMKEVLSVLKKEPALYEQMKKEKRKILYVSLFLDKTDYYLFGLVQHFLGNRNQ